MLTHQRLTEVLVYEPDTGVFRWRKNRKKCTAGGIAGSQRKDGYISIKVDYNRYFAHRLAWFYSHVKWPAEEVDHINRSPGDNRLSNLRLATRSQNATNRKRQSNNASGFSGVSFHRASGKWHARVRLDGRDIHLGLFTEPGDAAMAVMSAVRREPFSPAHMMVA